jgi:threonine dehydratase
VALTELPDPIDIVTAAERIRPHVHRTPLLRADHLGSSLLFLKAENLQRAGSFKIRGALNAVLRAKEEGRIGAAGVITYSSGNHGQAVALAARIVGCPSTIVAPEDIARVKLRAIEDLGGTVVLRGTTSEDRHAGAEEIARNTGAHIIPPYEHPDVIAGQGTVGLEILEDLPHVEVVVVPIGGGGLVAGIALAIKAARPDVRIVGVQAEGAPAMARSLREGRVVRVPPATMADGIRVGAPGQRTFEVVRELVDDVVTVSEEEIGEAVVQTLEKSKIVAETAGVVAVAALASGKVALGPGTEVCAVVSGGNIDLNLLARLIEYGLASQGSTHLLQLRVLDVPGQLFGVLELLAETRCNVLDVQHYRAGWKVPVGYVDVEILIETRTPGQGPEIERRLAERGFVAMR